MGSHWSYTGIALYVLAAILFWKYAAKGMFKTAPNGERLFYVRRWSRPYIVRDAATERRLYRKAAWFWRIVFASWLCLIFAEPWLGDLGDSPLVFLPILALLVLGPWLAFRFLFASDLRGLRRAEA